MKFKRIRLLDGPAIGTYEGPRDLVEGDLVSIRGRPKIHLGLNAPMEYVEHLYVITRRNGHLCAKFKKTRKSYSYPLDLAMSASCV